MALRGLRFLFGIAAVAAWIAVLAPAPQAQAASGSLPSIDLQRRCKNSESTLIEMMADRSLQGTAYDTCMKSEQDARNALQGAWQSLPASYASYCVRPRDYAPSYVEWIACVELMIDLKKQRATTDTTRSNVEPLARCPGLKYASDGSIIRINACAL